MRSSKVSSETNRTSVRSRCPARNSVVRTQSFPVSVHLGVECGQSTILVQSSSMTPQHHPSGNSGKSVSSTGSDSLYLSCQFLGDCLPFASYLASSVCSQRWRRSLRMRFRSLLVGSVLGLLANDFEGFDFVSVLFDVFFERFEEIFGLGPFAVATFDLDELVCVF